LTATVLAAFKTHRLVGLGVADNLQEHYDAVGGLLSDPRLPEAVDDIVVEFGNPLYRPVMDRFISGQPVADADLRPLWRNTTQSPVETWDQPVYEQFYQTVRAANWALPPGNQVRVLLGDSPIDWAKVTAASDFRTVPSRNAVVTALLRKQVLAKGHRALLCYGATGLLHGGGMAGVSERGTGERMYLISDLVPLAGDPGGLIPTTGTWLGSFDAGLLISNAAVGGPRGQPAKGARAASGRIPSAACGWGLSSTRACIRPA
jgi:hypothetical protein